MTPTTNPATPLFIRPRSQFPIFRLQFALSAARGKGAERTTQSWAEGSPVTRRTWALYFFGHGVWTWSSVFFNSVCARHPFPPETRPALWVTLVSFIRASFSRSLSIYVCVLSLLHTRLIGSLSPRFIGPPTPAGDWEKEFTLIS